MNNDTTAQTPVADLDEDIPFVIEDTLPPHGTPEREALYPYGFN